MKVLKFVVIAMAVLLVVGFGFLIWGMTTRGAAVATSVAVKPVPVPVAAADFGQVTVPLPAGAHVEQIQSAGDRVVVSIVVGAEHQVLVLDPVRGQVAGRFLLSSAPHP